MFVTRRCRTDRGDRYNPTCHSGTQCGTGGTGAASPLRGREVSGLLGSCGHRWQSLLWAHAFGFHMPHFTDLRELPVGKLGPGPSTGRDSLWQTFILGSELTSEPTRLLTSLHFVVSTHHPHRGFLFPDQTPLLGSLPGSSQAGVPILPRASWALRLPELPLLPVPFWPVSLSRLGAASTPPWASVGLSTEPRTQ